MLSVSRGYQKDAEAAGKWVVEMLRRRGPFRKCEPELWFIVHMARVAGHWGNKSLTAAERGL